MMDENKLKLWADIKHFTYSEFNDPSEKDSGLNMAIEFVRLLDQLRTKVGFPFEINSGFRSEAHNKEVGGKPDSAHTKGLAADVHCSTSGDRYEIVARACELGFKRIGCGDTFVHLDMSYELPQRVIWLYPPGAKG